MFSQETHTMSQRERAAHRAIIGLAAFLAIAVQGGAATGAAEDLEVKQTTGTVKAVEPDAGRISVITGVGHALRVMEFHADAACRVEVDGVVAPLSGLSRGRIVTVQFRSGAAPYAAERIATIPSRDVGGKR
jgi:hypothetical protein